MCIINYRTKGLCQNLLQSFCYLVKNLVNPNNLLMQPFVFACQYYECQGCASTVVAF